MEPITFILSIILLPLLAAFWKWLQLARAIEKFPGPRYIPFFGTVLSVWGSREELVELETKLVRKYGPLFRTWTGPFPVVNILKPQHAEVILKSHQNITKSQGMRLIKDWLGDSLLLATGPLWHSRRKLITPTFHFSILEDFTGVFIEKAEKLADILEEQSRGEYIDIFMTVKLCGLDIICKTAMGIELNAMDNSNRKYVQSVEHVAELIVRRVLSPWLLNDFIFKRSNLGKEYYSTLEYLHDFTRKVIKEKKLLEAEKPEDPGKKTRMAFLDLLLRVSKEDGLSDEALQSEVDTFMFAGHDTTTVATSWCLFLLGNHPQVQERVYEELESIFRGEDRRLTIPDLKEMKYLELCIKESLRLYPSAPHISRKVTHPFYLDGYVVPAGANVRIHIHHIHRDPEQYPEPNEFNPDNFLPENCAKRHPFAFVPFSAGLRNCIGQKFAMLEEKVLLATILRKFKVTALRKPEEMKVYHEIILRPQEGMKMKLELRK